MNEPEPVEWLPDEPLTETDATELLDRAGARAVWVMDHDPATRRSVLGEDPSDDAVIELVIETDDAFETYSYTHADGTTRWVSYGDQPADGQFEGTLASYRLVAGQTTTDLE